MKIAYVRVSTVEQNEARQIEALKKYDVDKWFTEKVSAKDTNRPQLQAMIDFAREGDTIYIHDFSRLARSTADLLKLVEQLQAKRSGRFWRRSGGRPPPAGRLHPRSPSPRNPAGRWADRSY